MKTSMLVGGVAALAFARSASGGLVSFTMVNGDGGGDPFNTVAFSVTNLSGPGVALESWTMTVGDTQFLYDFLYLGREQFTGGDGTQTALLTQGEHDNDNGAGPDAFAYAFTNFGPGVRFAGQWDIDFDSGAFNVDARTVLFNNGAAPNARATFVFSDGSTAEYTFPDLPVQDSYSLTIPGPGGAAVLALAFAGRRRRGGR
ncbi:MAG: hypothetical protein SFZ24_04470 [Planctomycetota bacterium]|nr:hypothetical protein [Planctomycetota bacterium]